LVEAVEIVEFVADNPRWRSTITTAKAPMVRRRRRSGSRRFPSAGFVASDEAKTNVADVGDG